MVHAVLAKAQDSGSVVRGFLVVYIVFLFCSFSIALTSFQGIRRTRQASRIQIGFTLTGLVPICFYQIFKDPSLINQWLDD